MFDIFGALTGLILFAPILIAVSLIIRYEMGSPILFKQERPGRNGKPFQMIKFRTMRHALGSDGQPLSDRERITKLGTFLRSSSLDELPELWNVLRGDMSLVGPRPLLMEYLPLYSPEQSMRHSVRPGITGWAQVNGRNALSWEEKFALDKWYVEKQSFLLDLKIIWMTAIKVINREDISAAGEVTMPKFEGLKKD